MNSKLFLRRNACITAPLELSVHLTYKSTDVVELTTLAHREGLGTMSWLLSSDAAKIGFSLLTIGPNVDTGLYMSVFGCKLPFPSLEPRLCDERTWK